MNREEEINRKFPNFKLLHSTLDYAIKNDKKETLEFDCTDYYFKKIHDYPLFDENFADYLLRVPQRKPDGINKNVETFDMIPKACPIKNGDLRILIPYMLKAFTELFSDCGKYIKTSNYYNPSDHNRCALYGMLRYPLDNKKLMNYPGIHKEPVNNQYLLFHEEIIAIMANLKEFCKSTINKLFEQILENKEFMNIFYMRRIKNASIYL